MTNSLNSLIDTFKMMYFMNIKDVGFFQNIALMIFLSLITFVLNNDVCYQHLENMVKNIFLSSPRFKCNKIILEGKRCLKISTFASKTEDMFSTRFKAFWFYIARNNLENPTINSLKEYAQSSNIQRKRDNNSRDDPYNDREDDENLDSQEFKDIYVVEQQHAFKINNSLLCRVQTLSLKADEKRMYDLENITIEIYSYTKSLKDIAFFLDMIEADYRQSLYLMRNNKKFIYTLIGNANNPHNGGMRDERIAKIWDEYEFKSYRTFDNIFFGEKERLLKKLNFFIENKDWYDREGHVHQFGLCLCGKPGTGKTSVIKSIANRLKRHLIVISLSKIKTQKEFSEYFFETYYNRNNMNRIDFKDKIIVFEDIDCMTDIVKSRDLKDIERDRERERERKKDIQADLLKFIQKDGINQNNDENRDFSVLLPKPENNDKITLSFILNILDGILETPGRILIITTNKLELLDRALIRPGRIDMILEMNYATVQTIQEMFTHYYHDEIPENVLAKLKDYKISPAKIVNIRLENERKEGFLERLVELCV